MRHYRDYSNYDNNIFRVSLFNELSKLNIEAIDLNKFITVSIGTLNNHAPSKKKYIRGNHLPFMNKELSKEIMHRTELRNNFLRNRFDENKRKYSKQRNYCMSLLRKTMKNYYSYLNEKKITDNEIVNLDASKSFHDTDYRKKLLKRMPTFLQTLFTRQLMRLSTRASFHLFLKLADVIPVFKTGSKNSKHNYRPISILKNM